MSVNCAPKISDMFPFFQQPAGLAKSSVDKGASTKREEFSAASNGEEKPGISQI